MSNVIINNRRQNKPMVSIVIVTFNASNYIRGALESIKTLDLNYFEVLIIDGQSTDDTLSVVDEFVGELPIRVISEPDLGIYDAMNKGVRNSKGDLLYFLGADDRLRDGFLILLESCANKDTVYYANVIKAKDKTRYLGKFNSYKLMRTNICHQAIIYPRKYLLLHPYDLKYKMLSDYANNLLLWGKYEFNYVPVDVCDYNDQGASSAGDTDFQADKSILIKSHLGTFWYLLYKFRYFVVCIKRLVVK
ncbi:glycosyltransferase [Vibrio cholerae]|uniref:glycosyltransferase n=1 Tax=Vibrio cholerae TaxID=666 RepID=UPI0018F0BBD9|nr:glycosyltransferase [Vibrio cholerae]MBJ6879712.1 glycosyltransferase [Vibrio cholerae]MBJ6883397.1 glycosyltransferase [Vibrio cholerae]MBJ6890756.1 glycosyltransferase [Vibrio cholerae]